METKPIVLVIFGITGDLTEKKLAPALFDLFREGHLKNVAKIIGFSRRDWSNLELKNHLRGILSKNNPYDNLDPFLDLFIYSQGNFDNPEDYQKLGETFKQIDKNNKDCSNKIFYIAAPPEYYKNIFNNLGGSKLTISCGSQNWTRIVVEKPFGKDLKTAQELDELLGHLFTEDQIYRVDHYLAKEILQDILIFRFSNNLLEDNWDKDHIEKIEVRLWESIGVKDRGSFYDGVGALRDVGQNHLLQMLALITMEQPKSWKPNDIRNSRLKIFQSLKPFTDQDIKNDTFRAQYKGFIEIPEVDKNSVTETFFKIIPRLNSDRWNGVNIVLESGKMMPEEKKEIIVTFKHPQPCLCTQGNHLQNQVIFRLSENPGIEIRFWGKKPGYNLEIGEHPFRFFFNSDNPKPSRAEDYSKILLDCINGDPTLFVSTKEVSALWKFIDPIANGWKNNLVILDSYSPLEKISNLYRQ